jgi:hypothetical protein
MISNVAYSANHVASVVKFFDRGIGTREISATGEIGYMGLG